MAGLGDLLGSGGAVEQIAIWGILNQLIGAALTPYMRLLENEVNSETQAFPLSPETLANLVLRGWLSYEQAVPEAKANGVSPDDFRRLVDVAGNPPGPGDLAEALRRGFIPEDSGDPAVPSFLGGIRQGNLRNEWADVIKRLAVQPPTPADILQALVEGQTDRATAEDLYRRLGGDPEYFDLLYNTRGGAPTPVQAADMANRGIIPWEGTGPEATSFEQAFREGTWRNKWLPAFRAAGAYLPPPRTVTAMVRAGSLTDQQAVKLFQQSGLSPELADAYLADAKHQRTAAHKQLTLGIIEELYAEEAITVPQTRAMIAALGYDDSEISFILSANDLKRAQQAIQRAISTIHGRYTNHKLDRAAASADLDQLGIAADMRDQLLGVWDTEREARVALLTPTQIRKAGQMGLLSADEALQRLVVWGYSRADAEIFVQL